MEHPDIYCPDVLLYVKMYQHLINLYPISIVSTVL